MPDDAQLSVS